MHTWLSPVVSKLKAGAKLRKLSVIIVIIGHLGPIITELVLLPGLFLEITVLLPTGLTYSWLASWLVVRDKVY